MFVQEGVQATTRANFWEADPGFWYPLGMGVACLLLAGMLALARRFRRRHGADVPRLDADQLEQLMQGKPPILVDLRTPAEFRGPRGHIRGAMNIPLAELEARLGELEGPEPRAVVLIDERGVGALKAARLLQARGHSWFYVLDGGFHAWRLEHMPTYSGVQK